MSFFLHFCFEGEIYFRCVYFFTLNNLLKKWGIQVDMPDFLSGAMPQIFMVYLLTKAISQAKSVEVINHNRN